MTGLELATYVVLLACSALFRSLDGRRTLVDPDRRSSRSAGPRWPLASTLP